MIDRSNPAPARPPFANTHSSHDLRVAAPDAVRGFMLVQRLPGSRLIGSEAEGWIVAGSANGDLPRVLASIQQWLRDEGIPMTDVGLGGQSHTMTRD